jgi:hypothetical protein
MRPPERRLRFGSVVLDDPGGPPGRRVGVVDRRGQLAEALAWAPDGTLAAAWVRAADGGWIGIQPGSAEHPLWGPSDSVTRGAGPGSAPAEPLTLCAAVAWERVAAIPALADPTRLPVGAGSALLNLLAGLAADQGAGTLRYRGPFPTEQLFWALGESFRPDPAVAEPLARFTADAEAVFAAGQAAEAPLDWTPAPHERLALDGGIVVQLRGDGVEKVYWEGRGYARVDGSRPPRHEPRVVRPVPGPDGAPRFAASLVALGRPIADHLVLDAVGELVARPDDAAAPADEAPDVPLDAAWQPALGALLGLAATPLLAPAIEAVWPELRLTWGGVPRDLAAERGVHLRLSRRLLDVYRETRRLTPPAERRALAQALVRDVLALLGGPVRRAAADWLEAQPANRQQGLLHEAAGRERRAAALAAAGPLASLLDRLATAPEPG